MLFRSRMGVNLEDLTVTGITDGSVAEQAGCKTGDVFLTVDGASVKDREGLVDAIQQDGPKKLIKLKRGDELLELTFEWPEAAPKPREPSSPRP